MNADEVVQRAITGAKWTIILSVIALPIAYVTNIMLGRLSPEVLGTYSLLNIFILFVASFILFGGNSVIVRFLPQIDRDRRAPFLTSYFLVVIAIAVAAMAIMFFFPQILELLLGENLPEGDLSHLLIILVPVVTLFFIFVYTLNALMEIKTSVILRQAIVYGNFVVFLALFFFARTFFSEHASAIIWGFSLALYIVMALLSWLLTRKKMRIAGKGNPSPTKLEPYLPAGFWGFSLFVHASSIVYFVYDKVDQLFVVHYFNVGELGLYYAVLQTALLIRFIPMLIGNVLLPTFSNLIASNDTELIHKGYQEAVKYTTLLTVVASLCCIFFSKEILGLFGAAYVGNHLMLVTLAIFFGVTSMGGINSSLVIAKGRAGWYLGLQIIMVSVQLMLTFYLIEPFGVIGAALAKGVAVLIGQIGLIYIVLRVLKMGVHIPRQFFVGVATISIAALLYYFLTPSSALISLGLFLPLVIIFIYLAPYSKKDLNFIREQVLRKKS